jgi:hypothetical protein
MAFSSFQTQEPTEDIQVRTEAGTDQETGPDASLHENARRRRRLPRLPDLNQGEGDEEQNGQDE